MQCSAVRRRCTERCGPLSGDQVEPAGHYDSGSCIQSHETCVVRRPSSAGPRVVPGSATPLSGTEEEKADSLDVRDDVRLVQSDATSV